MLTLNLIYSFTGICQASSRKFLAIICTSSLSSSPWPTHFLSSHRISLAIELIAAVSNFLGLSHLAVN
ncbi:hypothetical protein SLEP1_g43128 [Rubroshorea leprosula]|uniref:Uncharacterized protein n=1 Tax=Rubroshorea leprosula TaxID=152421 RepID=A0AAV5LCK2_9ROSI|nr:hypothetical protein SLEP1_g43128 [Rubroshorea leprosula]